MKRPCTLLAAALLASSLGCAPDDDVTAQQEFHSENNIRVTYNGDLALLGSYNSLFDKSADTACVKYQDEGLHARVSEPSRHLSIELVRHKEDLAKKLGIDLKLKARYAGIEGNAAANLLDEFSSATNSVTFLLSAQADYVVRDAAIEGRSVVLSDGGVGALEEGAAAFARKCGTHYVNGVRYGGRFYLLITFKASSHRAKTHMDASLGVDGTSVASGDVKARLERTANTAGVQTTLKTASNGFWLNGQPSVELVKALQSANVDQDLFTGATKLYFDMVKAVEHDYCLDAGNSDCSGEAGVGYFQRSSRDTAVTGVQLASYHSLANATWEGDENPFATIKERMDTFERFVRNYTEIQVRMDNIYYDEIKPFFDADPKLRPMYNIAPPGTAKRTPLEVYDVAKEVDELIYPPLGGVMGWLREDAHDRIKRCLELANVDIMASCTENDEYHSRGGEPHPGSELEADETKQWNELYGFFDEYHNTKRILPLQVAVGEHAVVYRKGQNHCDYLAENLNEELAEQGSSTIVQYRMPTLAEARQLAPAISHGNISWSDADIKHAIWYQPVDGDNNCGKDYPYYKNEPTGSSAWLGCADNDWWDDELTTLCVPASGPIPLMPPQ